jgi:phosphate:Na+ symporter
MFNVGGVLLWFAWIDPLAAFVTKISPAAPEFAGAAGLSAVAPRQIANAHTVFNVVNTLVFIGFSKSFARAVEWLVPDRPVAVPERARAKYLDVELLTTPSLALDRTRMEILQLGEHVAKMFRRALPMILDGTPESIEDVVRMDDDVDAIYGQIVSYLGKVSQEALTERQMGNFLNLMEAANALESIGDIIETNLAALSRQRLSNRIAVSETTRRVIEEFHAAVSCALDRSMQAVTQRNMQAALQVTGMKAEVNRMAGAAALHEARRLTAAEPNRIPAYAMEMDVLENLKRVYYFTKRMSRSVVRSGTSDAG